VVAPRRSVFERSGVPYLNAVSRKLLLEQRLELYNPELWEELPQRPYVRRLGFINLVFQEAGG
jgi:hypothetical protein